MSEYKPNMPFHVPCTLMIPQSETIKGVSKKTYRESDTIFCSFRSFGGTEKIVNDVLVVENTATLETWYRPDIVSGCRFLINGTQYEVLGTPENINMRNQFLIVKIRALQGGV